MGREFTSNEVEMEQEINSTKRSLCFQGKQKHGEISFWLQKINWTRGLEGSISLMLMLGWATSVVPKPIQANPAPVVSGQFVDLIDVPFH